jgi:hypothetical protein
VPPGGGGRRVSAPRTLRQAAKAALAADGVLAGRCHGRVFDRFDRTLAHAGRPQLAVRDGGTTTEPLGKGDSGRVQDTVDLTVEAVARGADDAENLGLEVVRVLDGARPEIAGAWPKGIVWVGTTLAEVEDLLPEDGSLLLWRASVAFRGWVERER